MNSAYDLLRRAKTLIGWSASLLVLAVMVSAATAQQFPIQQNETLSYQFDATLDNLTVEGGIHDYSGSSFNGTALSFLGLPPGEMKFVAGNPAAPVTTTAIAMAGDDDFPGTGIWTGATTAQVGIFGGSFTAMAFVNRNNLHILTIGDQMVFGTTGIETVGSALHLGFRNSNTYFGFWGNDSNAAGVPSFVGLPPSPTTTQWHHMAWRYNAGQQNQDIFIDGVLANSDSGHGVFVHNQPLLIGLTGPDRVVDTAAFSGMIEYVRVFNAALTDAQIASAAKYQY